MRGGAGIILENLPLIGNMLQDLFFGARILWRSKGFAAAALVTLALGIGVNSAIFSIVDAVLLRPLPYPHSNRLVTLWQSRTDAPRNTVTGPDFRDWRDRAQSYQAMAAVTGDTFNKTGSGRPISYSGLRVSTTFFSVLGIAPALGRSFAPSEAVKGRNHVAVISYRMWEGSFGGSPDTVGKTLILNRQAYTIIGIMPGSFKFLDFHSDIWVPLSPGETSDRHDHNLMVIARLKKHVSVAAARAELSGIAAQLARAYPETNSGWTAAILSLHAEVVGGVRSGILLLLGAVGLLLLIACANIANLLLLRAARRRHEMGIRAAVGASPGRMTRQLLTESILLGVMGGVLGLLVAWAAVHIVRALNPGNIPRLDEVQLNASVLGFTLLLSCLAGIVFGVFPALQSWRCEIVEWLREEERSGAGGLRMRYTQSVFVGAEAALSLLLLVGASLLLRSLIARTDADLGLRPGHLLTMSVRLDEHQYSSEQQEAANFQRVVDRLQSLRWAGIRGESSRLSDTRGLRAKYTAPVT